MLQVIILTIILVITLLLIHLMLILMSFVMWVFMWVVKNISKGYLWYSKNLEREVSVVFAVIS